METEDGSTQINGAVNGMVNGHEIGEEAQTQKPKLRLKFDEYKRISNLIVGYMQATESKLGEGKLRYFNNNCLTLLYYNFIIINFDVLEVFKMSSTAVHITLTWNVITDNNDNNNDNNNNNNNNNSIVMEMVILMRFFQK